MAIDVFFVFEYKQQYNIKMTASFPENKTLYLYGCHTCLKAAHMSTIAMMFFFAIYDISCMKRWRIECKHNILESGADSKQACEEDVVFTNVKHFNSFKLLATPHSEWLRAKLMKIGHERLCIKT